MEDTAKAVNDVKLRFREERHTLKQQVSYNLLQDYLYLLLFQIRDHLKLDFTGNADPDMAAELTRTKAYLMKHVGDIIPGVELLVYHMVSNDLELILENILLILTLFSGLHHG